MRALTTALFVLCAFPSAAGLTIGAIVPDARALSRPADVNGDGLTDLIQERDAILNQGGGIFVVRSLGLADGDHALDWLDANGDGIADILANDTKSNGPGGSPAKQTYRVYIAGDNGRYANGVVVPNNEGVPYIAEVNGDGKEDIVLLRPVFAGNRNLGTEVQVLISKGDGTFTPRTPFRIGRDPQISLSNRLAAGDLDRDGRPDLVIRTYDELAILRGTGNGDFAVEARYLPGQPFGYNATKFADVDGDGNLDVLLAGQRTVRVFLGDGTGRLPRLATAAIEQVREPVYPPWLVIVPPPGGAPPLTPVNAGQPRTLAIGQFIEKGRTEIAAPAGEGDVVIFAWERGALREVARVQTDLLLPDLHAGAFLGEGRTDLYATWNFGYQAQRPLPKILAAEPKTPDAPEPPRSLRTRALRGGGPRPLVFDVEATGECVTSRDTWTLSRDGVFGSEKTGERTVETVLEGGVLSFRLQAPWTVSPAYGALSANGLRYEGRVEIETPCGWKFVTLVATVR
jgi:FG-GAP-like repeat